MQALVVWLPNGTCLEFNYVTEFEIQEETFKFKHIIKECPSSTIIIKDEIIGYTLCDKSRFVENEE